MRFKRFLLTFTILTFVAFAFNADESIAQDDFSMGFFITSNGPGNGADFGGLAGADAHCQTLAEAVGSGDRTWRAYLSAQAKDDQVAINARDRIGSGPWHNALGVIVANSVDELHGENNLNKETALNENGEIVNGRGDNPNRHDILTGSQLDGTLLPGDGDSTCNNWTSSGAGSALLGHHDRQGGGDNPTSWNSAHASRGCSQSNLQSTGGDGLFYCFAADGFSAGDVDGDGLLTTADIDLITAAVAAGASESRFDVDGDGIVSAADRNHWIDQLRRTWRGDANLDGEFNSSDLVEVFQAGKFETAVEAGWADGDWNGDLIFDTSDFVVAFEDGGFEQGPRAAVRAVPEPSTEITLLLGVVGLCRFRRTRPIGSR